MPGQAIVTIKDRQWACSVASTPAELVTGLSGVPSIPPGTGMLFVLGYEQIVTVTAEDMLFPLSVVFFGGIPTPGEEDMLYVTEVAPLLAPGDWGTTSLPCRYFLEVNFGEADGSEAGDQVDIAFSAPPTTDWMAPVVTLAGVVMVGAVMVKMGKAMTDAILGKTMADAVFGKPKEKPVLYGPRGELLPQTKRGKFLLKMDRMGHIIITHTERPGDVFLQFASDKDVVSGLLKKGERKDLDAGWTVEIKETEPRASIMQELWETAAGPGALPAARKRKPYRSDVKVGSWVERDRIGIWITDKRTDKTIAEWWDEDVREMFEQGWFKPGDIRHQTITGRAFEESVLDYAECVGILTGGKYLAQAIKDAYYWTAINKDTGEIVESHAPYTSSVRALRGGKAFVSRHWRRGDTALIEVWRQPYRYSEGLKIQPGASETITVGQSPAVIPTEPRLRRSMPDELEFLPDSPEFLAYTIEDIGYREKIDNAFLGAIDRARKGR